MAEITTFLGLEKPIGGEKHSRAMVNRNYDRVENDAIANNKQAKGALVRSPITTNSGFITALTVISNIASYTFKGGREYLLKWDFTYQGNTAGNYMTALIGTCAVADAASLTTGIAQLNGRPWKVHDASINASGHVEAWYKPAADTTLQIKFMAQVTTGTGTIAITGSALQPIVLIIEDRGAQA